MSFCFAVSRGIFTSTSPGVRGLTVLDHQMRAGAPTVCLSRMCFLRDRRPVVILLV